MPSLTLINGTSYGWSNLTLVLFGIPVTGITKISWKRKQKKENNYGWGVEPIGRGYGNKEYEGSMDIYQDELLKIIAAAPNKNALDIPMFDIQIVYGGSKVLAQKDVLRACEFTEEGLEAAQNDTKLIVTLPLVIGAVNR